jgi:hypothetical protein
MTGYPRDNLPSCPVTPPIFETLMKLLFQSNPQHCCHVFMNVLIVLKYLSFHGEDMHINENQNWGIMGMFLSNNFFCHKLLDRENPLIGSTIIIEAPTN